MPIYDNDGTTSREINKLYDNNGSVSTPINKVYDYNGTTNSLIYTSFQEYLYQNGYFPDYTGTPDMQMLNPSGMIGIGAAAYEGSTSVIEFDPDANYGGGSYYPTNRYFVNTTKKIDITDMDRIAANLTGTVKATCSDKSKATWDIYWGIALSTDLPDAKTMSINSFTRKAYKGGIETPANAINFSPGLLTLDVSSYTGSYYVFLFLEMHNALVNGSFVTSYIRCD